MLSPGTILGGRYRLDERIAGGGMGDVWRGTDEVLGRTVAIKVLLQSLMEEPGFAERFRGEARTMATINHPGVVDVYDYGNEQNTAFLIMEYVEGDALARTLGRVTRLTPSRTMSLIAQAADALHAAHIKGIVHRDVKPGNLLVRPNGTLVLTDFGIARAAQAAQLTAVGSVLGTAAYISPEQASGQQATALSDIYALGIVAYQCLAGRRPFEGDNPLEIAMRHVRDVPPPLPSDIPPAVCQIVERSMAKDPAARWPTAAALADAARAVAGQLSSGNTGGMTSVSAPPAGMPSSGGPLGVGGTRMFPSPGSPVSGVPGSGGPAGVTGMGPGMPGGFSRGAAGVPKPHPAAETGYANQGPIGQQPGRPYPNQPRSSSRQNLLITATILSVLAVLMLAGGIYYIANNDSDGSGGNPASSQTTVSATNSPAKSPKSTATGHQSQDEITIDCDSMRNKSRMFVETDLRNQGFKVTVTLVDEGGAPNTVVDIEPCQAKRGATINLTVTTGSDGSQPSKSPSTSASCLLNTCPSNKGNN